QAVDLPQHEAACLGVALVSAIGRNIVDLGDDGGLGQALQEFIANVAAVARGRAREILEIFLARERQDRLDPPAGWAGGDRDLIGALGKSADHAEIGGVVCVYWGAPRQEARARARSRRGDLRRTHSTAAAT